MLQGVIFLYLFFLNEGFVKQCRCLGFPPALGEQPAAASHYGNNAGFGEGGEGGEEADQLLFPR